MASVPLSIEFEEKMDSTVPPALSTICQETEETWLGS